MLERALELGLEWCCSEELPMLLCAVALCFVVGGICAFSELQQ